MECSWAEKLIKDDGSKDVFHLYFGFNNSDSEKLTFDNMVQFEERFIRDAKDSKIEIYIAKPDRAANGWITLLNTGHDLGKMVDVFVKAISEDLPESHFVAILDKGTASVKKAEPRSFSFLNSEIIDGWFDGNLKEAVKSDISLIAYSQEVEPLFEPNGSFNYVNREYRYSVR